MREYFHIIADDPDFPSVGTVDVRDSPITWTYSGDDPGVADLLQAAETKELWRERAEYTDDGYSYPMPDPRYADRLRAALQWRDSVYGTIDVPTA